MWRTGKGIPYENQDTGHGIIPCELLQQSQIQLRICLPIGEQNRFRLCARLSVDFLDQSELLGGHQSCALVALDVSQAQ